MQQKSCTTKDVLPSRDHFCWLSRFCFVAQVETWRLSWMKIVQGVIVWPPKILDVLWFIDSGRMIELGVWSSRIGNCRWNSPFEKWTEETFANFAIKKSASTLPYLTSQGPPNQEGSHFRLQISQIEFSKSKTQSGEPQKLLLKKKTSTCDFRAWEPQVWLTSIKLDRYHGGVQDTRRCPRSGIRCFTVATRLVDTSWYIYTEGYKLTTQGPHLLLVRIQGCEIPYICQPIFEILIWRRAQKKLQNCNGRGLIFSAAWIMKSIPIASQKRIDVIAKSSSLIQS